jgi:hypothetical protein
MALIPFHHHHQPISNLCVPPRHARTLSLHDHILQAYLPWFTTNQPRPHHEPDVDLILDSWLRSNPELLEPAMHFPLREREFRGAFYMVIDAIEDADADADADDFGTEPAVMVDASNRLLEKLDDEWDEDVEFGGGSGKRAARSQRLFRALAEVSHATGSRMLGSVLRTFFLGWLHELVEEEDSVALAGWCWGIARAWIDPREKEGCLRALVALRSDVLAELNGRAGADWLPLPLHALNNVAGTMRDWPRRRRAAGRRWWDDENDRRIRRMVEDSEYYGRGADRGRRRMVSLHLGDDNDYYRRPAGRARPIRSSRSLDSVLRQSRSPRLRHDSDAARRLRYLEDIDQDNAYLPATGQRLLEDRTTRSRAQSLRNQAKQALLRQIMDD